MLAFRFRGCGRCITRKGRRLPLKPTDALDTRDGHVARKVPIVDWGCHVDGRKEALEPFDKSAEFDTGQEELVRLRPYSDDVATPENVLAVEFWHAVWF